MQRRGYDAISVGHVSRRKYINIYEVTHKNAWLFSEFPNPSHGIVWSESTTKTTPPYGIQAIFNLKSVVFCEIEVRKKVNVRTYVEHTLYRAIHTCLSKKQRKEVFWAYGIVDSLPYLTISDECVRKKSFRFR